MKLFILMELGNTWPKLKSYFPNGHRFDDNRLIKLTKSA